MNESQLHEIHSKSTLNRHAIEASNQVGCFCCERIWDPLDFPIKEWIDDTPFLSRMPDAGMHGNATALCPFCGIDSVIAKLSVGEITHYMLGKMQEFWFGLRKRHER
ncbi:hypothetical protein LCGC14_0244250 [marine sediment metagenome]|uniref:Cytoplasmic protein n=1 Tax=marine sediment metagenome TaxID=412755 RepID=A0A0F9XB26_9ZZZZ